MTVPTMRELRLRLRGGESKPIKYANNNRTICLKCKDMQTCESVETCKSCGGRKVVKRIIGPCPKRLF